MEPAKPATRLKNRRQTPAKGASPLKQSSNLWAAHSVMQSGDLACKE
jgi:hypothetical protein